MLAFHQSLPILIVLLFCSLTAASQWEFAIQEILIEDTTDSSRDNLTLAIAAATESQNITKNWLLGSFAADSTIRWDNLTLEIDFPNDPSNFSLLFGMVNDGNLDENNKEKFVNSLVQGAASLRVQENESEIGADIAEVVFDILDLENCEAPAALGNATYSVEALDSLERNQKSCQTETYFMEDWLPNSSTDCGVPGSNYTITYCLQRLDGKNDTKDGTNNDLNNDAENAAGVTSPQSGVCLWALLVALTFSVFF